jgi:replicative DNA helicase
VSVDVDIAQDAILGLVLNFPTEAARVFGTVPAEAFEGRRALIAHAIQGLRLRREPVDMATVSIELQKRGHLSRVGGATVAQLASDYTIRPTLDYHLDVMVRHIRLCKLEAIGTRLVQYTGATDADPIELAELARQQAQAIIDAGEADADVDTMTLDEFLAVEDAEYDWVIPGLLERSDRLILTGSEGLGKALALDTPIPTPKGWTTMGNVTVGSEVFGPDGKPAVVVAATDVMRDRPCYRVRFSDGSSIVADAEHLWATETQQARDKRSGGQIVTTAQLADTLRARGGHCLNHAIPTTAPLAYPAQELPIAPYVMGAWLGDGHSAGSRLTSADQEVIDQIRLTEPVVKGSTQYGWSISDGHKGSRRSLTTRLRTLGVLNKKHIPEMYQRGSVDQRLELLRGLMDTDGCVTATVNSHVCEFTATNHRLAVDVTELLAGLGIKASIREGVARIGGRDVGPKWRITFTTGLRVFHLTRKVERQTPSTTRRASLRYITAVEPVEPVPVRCIQVDREDGMYVAGEACIPTHNSTLFRQLAVMTAGGLHPFTGRSIPQQRVLYVDCENGPTHMRRKLRPLAIQAKAHGPGAGSTLFIEGRPEGLNLLDPAGQQWLVARVAALQPAVLFTGSLYKLFEGDPNKEEPARAVAAVLDRCRAVANCAIVIEAHSGHGMTAAGDRHVRPVGASLWLRWPEFGYGLRATKDFDPATRVVEFTPWRGDRDERNWPRRLKAGSTWPWEQATYDPYNDLEAVS